MRFPLLSILMIACRVAGAEENALTIRPVQVISQAEVPAGAPQGARSIRFNKGFTIGYLVEGSDIIGIDQKSLTVDHILIPGGKDIAIKRNGKPNYELGSFPEVSDDGRFAFFELQSEEHVFGKAETLDIKGSIKVRTATHLSTVISKPHALASEEAETLEGFTMTFGPGKDVKIPMFLEDDYKTKSMVVVTGPLRNITEVRLLVAGKELESDSYTSSETGPRTYFFTKDAATAPGAMRIKYWKDLKEVSVPIGKP